LSSAIADFSQAGCPTSNVKTVGDTEKQQVIQYKS